MNDYIISIESMLFVRLFAVRTNEIQSNKSICLFFFLLFFPILHLAELRTSKEINAHCFNAVKIRDPYPYVLLRLNLS